MTVPSYINYPLTYDTEDNLFVVHDSLRMTLANDYNPGDTSITVSGDSTNFPPTGIITLTEQCSDPSLRAISFYYGSMTSTSFDELELIPWSVDAWKPQNYTDVTLNVIADHHNQLAAACFAIESFVGVKGSTDLTTITGRLNFLKNLVLPPRAWFSSDVDIGMYLTTIQFADNSLNSPTSWTWDFGDGGTSTNQNPSHQYINPGDYGVTLTVTNDYGTDTITIPNMIHIHADAPGFASFDLINTSPSARNNGLYPFATGQLVSVSTSTYLSYLTDPIVEYTWNLGDDLPHNNAAEAVALYSVGGIYDIKLRVDTEYGAYRITTDTSAIDVVEQTNLWLVALDSPLSTLSLSKGAHVHEFGLTSEVWKTDIAFAKTISRNYSFLGASSFDPSDYQNDVVHSTDYQTFSFLRNNGITQQGTTSSGDSGSAIMYWADTNQSIQYAELTPFLGTWSSSSIFGLTSSKQSGVNWNWFTFSDTIRIYIMLGLQSLVPLTPPPNVSLSRIENDMSTNTAGSPISYTSPELSNGASELGTLPDSVPATYRACYSGGNGYFARNNAGPGNFFRIVNFYQTSGDFSDYATNILKLPDIPGSYRTELQLVPLASGIYVFNNTGEVSVYSPSTNTWQTGGPSVGSAAFQSLQDLNVTGFDSSSNSLLATSDSDHQAYLSYDYSPNAFIKFNDSDGTFSLLGPRPTSNEQFAMIAF